MKYEERLFELGKIINDKKSVSELKDDLLKILFKEYNSQIEKMDYSELSGTLEKDFLIQCYGPKDEGIDQILKLQEFGELNSLENDYYITFEEIYGYEAQGYKAIWDYETYFSKVKEESLKQKKR